MDYFLYVGDLPVPKSARYLDFSSCRNPKNHEQKELYIMPDQLSGSEYGGGLLCKANFESFWTQFSGHEGVHVLHGSMGTYAIAIRADVSGSDEEIVEVLAGLDDYPLIDEDEYRKQETNAQQEAWEGWAESDVTRKITDALEALDIEWEVADDFDLEALFNDCMNEANEFWAEQSDGSMFIRTAKIAAYMVDHILVQTLEDKDLPLIMSREWSSPGAKEKFFNRIKGSTPCTAMQETGTES